MKRKKKQLDTYQIWQCSSAKSSCTSFGLKGPKIKREATMGFDEGIEPVLLGEIVAENWDEAMTKYYKFMGFPAYVPMDYKRCKR